MSVIKVLRDLNGLFNYSTDENPTSQQDYQKAVKNWVKTIVRLVDSNLWQPETEYVVGDTVKTPSKKDTVLYCLEAGTTGAAEPDYTDPSPIMGIGDIITDGTVTWLLFQPVARVSRIEERIDSLAPTGVVQAFAGSTTPQGWLLCDGSAVSRTNYAALYAVIGTTYGAGNGSTTFNLPNLVDKFVEGSATAGTVKSAGLPNITGSFNTRCPWIGAAASGAFAPDSTGGKASIQQAGNETANYNALSFSANKSNSIYGKSTTVQPPALTMRYIIKY